MVSVKDIVTIEVTTDMVDEATKTATLKAKYTKDTWLLGRDPEERFGTLYMGDLAKVALKNWLRGNGKKVVDYDEERTDSFKNDDKFDLYLINAKTSKNLEVEIKSSIEKKQDFKLVNTLQSRHLMVYPGREKDINVQAYFLPSTGEFKNVHLISWIDKPSLIKFSLYTMPAQSGRERNRKQYDAVLDELKPMLELLTIIK